MEWMFSLNAADKPEVLTRISLIFRRQMSSVRSFSSTQLGESLRVNVLAETDARRAQRITALLRKLYDVTRVESYATEGASNLLALMKVQCTQPMRPQLLQLVEAFQARVLAVSDHALTILATGTAAEMHNLNEVLQPFGIIEETLSGPVFRAQGSAADAMSWDAVSIPVSERATMAAFAD